MSLLSISSDQAVEFMVESNAIEGIYVPTKLTEIAWNTRMPADAEVSGQIHALNYLGLLPLERRMTRDIILAVHWNLMENLLPRDYQGFRKLGVRVGYRICPQPYELHDLIATWIKNVNKLRNPTEAEVWQTHLAYEYIHPFIDGNGRSGRLLWLWMRYKYGFEYACVKNDTKHLAYYPQFDTFNWNDWCRSFSGKNK
jgi:Fic family protein